MSSRQTSEPYAPPSEYQPLNGLETSGGDDDERRMRFQHTGSHHSLSHHATVPELQQVIHGSNRARSVPRPLKKLTEQDGADKAKVGGRLRVQCTKAVGLAGADRFLLRAATSDPWAEITVNTPHQTWRVATRTVKENINPVWQEEFWFHTSKKMEHLNLHIDVFDEDYDGSDFLGQADLDISHEDLTACLGRWKEHIVKLVEDPERRSPVRVSGKVHLWITWEPPALSTWTAFFRMMLRSAYALRILGAMQLGTAALLAFVAAQCRWLCTGDNGLPGCTEIEVPGAKTCTVLAAFGAFISASIHFGGAAGLLTDSSSNWFTKPPDIADITDAEQSMLCREDNGDEDEEGNPIMSMIMEPESLISGKWHVDLVKGSACSLAPMSMRLAAWIAQLVAIGMSVLGQSLAWFEKPHTAILAEAWYLSTLCVFCILGGALTFRYQHSMVARTDKRKVKRFDPERAMDARRARKTTTMLTLANANAKQLQKVLPSLPSLARPLLPSNVDVDEEPIRPGGLSCGLCCSGGPRGGSTTIPPTPSGGI